MTDGELVLAIKRGEESPTVLYKRYLPMIDKHARKASMYIPVDKQEFILDYEQEAYFVILKAINYVDEKYIFGDEWKFSLVFSLYLKNMDRGFFQKEQRKRKHNFSFIFTLDDLKRNTPTTPFEDRLDDFVSKEFFDKITERQKRILSCRRDGLTLKETAKKIGLCSYTIIKEIQEAKKVAEDVFCMKLA